MIVVVAFVVDVVVAVVIAAAVDNNTLTLKGFRRAPDWRETCLCLA